MESLVIYRMNALQLINLSFLELEFTLVDRFWYLFASARKAIYFKRIEIYTVKYNRSCL